MLLQAYRLRRRLQTVSLPRCLSYAALFSLFVHFAILDGSSGRTFKFSSAASPTLEVRELRVWSGDSLVDSTAVVPAPQANPSKIPEEHGLAPAPPNAVSTVHTEKEEARVSTKAVSNLRPFGEVESLTAYRLALVQAVNWDYKGQGRGRWVLELDRAGSVIHVLPIEIDEANTGFNAAAVQWIGTASGQARIPERLRGSPFSVELELRAE